MASSTGTSIQQEDKNSVGTKILLNLGLQPLVNNLCRSKEASLAAKQYPICATIDNDLCIQLDTEVPSDELYKDYLYYSGISMPYIQHCRQLWHSIKHLRHDTILDIGGNDGTLLKAFQSQTEEKLNLYNCDASQSFRKENEEAGITYVNDYFNKKSDVPKADIITTTNAFQHTPNAAKFVEGIAEKLDGTWILEFPYTLRTLQTIQFDQFYHEHYYYWLVKPLKKLFSQFGLKIYHAEEVDIHGGSMRLWITNKEQYADTEAAEKFIREEEAYDYNAFYSRTFNKIARDSIFFNKLEGKTVFFGAAAKGCVYLNTLNSFSIFKNSYVIDDTPHKQGKYVPGVGLKIVDREFFLKDEPDNVVILAHNFAGYIRTKLRHDGYKGRIITMLPDIYIDEIQDHVYGVGK
tara:strand:- start:2361 stop:3578 length:1218 start_codon:yes stop_codon:yes gene_type:complete